MPEFQKIQPKPAVSSSENLTPVEVSRQGTFNRRAVSINRGPPAVDLSKGSLADVQAVGTAGSKLQDRQINAAGVQLSQKLALGNIQSLANYLTNATESGDIPSAHTEDLTTAITYAEQLDKDISRAVTLLEKADSLDASGQSLNEGEQRELNTLIESNRHNIQRVHAWIGQKQAALQETGKLTPATQAVFDALNLRLADRHIDIADLVSLHDLEPFPDKHFASRSDRIHMHLVEAKSALKVAESLNLPGLNAQGKNTLVTALKEQQAQLEQAQALADNPRSQLELTEDLKILDKALWSDPIPLTKSPGKLEEALVPLQQQWSKRLGVPQASGPWLPLAHPSIPQEKMLSAFIEFHLAQAGIKDMPPVEFLMGEARAKVLNEQAWDPIQTQINYSVVQKGNAADQVAGKFKFHFTEQKGPSKDYSFGDPRWQAQLENILNPQPERVAAKSPEVYTATSTITPAKALQQNFAIPYESNGVSASDRLTNYQHAPNLAQTTLHDKDGSTLFSGLRHGVLDPYHINAKNLKRLPDATLKTMVRDLLVDTEFLSTQASEEEVDNIVQTIRSNSKTTQQYALAMRSKASENMAREIASAALISDPGKFQRALNGETVPLSLSSISLLTPDHLRSSIPQLKMTTYDEKGMLQNQTNAFRTLANAPQPITLQVRDAAGQLRDVKANIKMRTFNFGVDAGAVGTFGGVKSTNPLMKRMMGWAYAMKQNDPELLRLVGYVDPQQLSAEDKATLQQLERELEVLQKQRAEAQTIKGDHPVASRLQARIDAASARLAATPLEKNTERGNIIAARDNLLARRRELMSQRVPLDDPTVKPIQDDINRVSGRLLALRRGEVGVKLRELKEQQDALLVSRDEKLAAGIAPGHADIQTLNDQIETLGQQRANLAGANEQIRNIWSDGSYVQGGNEPYKIVSRLAYVSHLMGDTPLFNCKSGKDRTGQLDSEVKMFAAMSARGQTPNVDSAELKPTRGQFSLNTGNLEMQRLNTGLPGFKLRGVPGLKEMFANAQMYAEYVGGSDFVPR